MDIVEGLNFIDITRGNSAVNFATSLVFLKEKDISLWGLSAC